MKVKFNKLPKQKRYAFDAGIDLSISDVKDIPIVFNNNDIIKLPYKVDIPQGCMGLLLPRSSFAIAGGDLAIVPIDSGYNGYIHAFIRCEEPIEWVKNKPFCQLVIIPCVDIVPYASKLNKRNTNMNGSTDNKEIKYE